MFFLIFIIFHNIFLYEFFFYSESTNSNYTRNEYLTCLSCLQWNLQLEYIILLNLDLLISSFTYKNPRSSLPFDETASGLYYVLQKFKTKSSCVRLLGFETLLDSVEASFFFWPPYFSISPSSSWICIDRLSTAILFTL